MAHQAVAGGQVPVHKVEGGEVDHARGDLRGDVQHVAQRQRPLGLARALLQDLGIGAVGPAGQRGCLERRTCVGDGIERHWEKYGEPIIRKLIRNKEIKSDIWKAMKRQGICIFGLKAEKE